MSSSVEALEAKAAALAAEADRLSRNGQGQAAVRLWEQVLAVSPDHSGALTQLGARALAAGDLAGADALLRRAVGGRPPSALARANLARVHAARGDLEAALAELDAALKIDPSAFAAHFEKAALYERLGRTKDQALAYQSALQLMPASAVTSQTLPLVERARATVAANQAQLAAFLDARLAPVRSGLSSRQLARFDESLDITLGRKPLQLSAPALYRVPGLPSIAFFEREDLPWSRAVEACTEAVRAELEAVLSDDAGGFVPYVRTGPGEDSGQFAPLDRNPDWSAYFLWQHGRPIEPHIARCPRTMAMLADVPQVAIANRAPAVFFSALRPHTRIPPHNGATNCRLTCHLPLIIPPDCALRVGNHVRGWTPGELLVFDDTIEHAAWNDSDQLRVVLIFDVWHPMLTGTERVLIRETLEGVMAYYGADAPLGEL